MSTRPHGPRAVVAAVLLALTLAGCARGAGPTYRVDDPSFHSAGPGAQDEIQSVLDSQARTIVRGDWRSLLDLYIPTERSRCPLDRFAEAADQSLGELRDRSRGSKLAARLSGVHLDGFRALVDYQFVLPTLGLASPAQKGHYLKLGDRWFIDEKAC